MEGLSPNELTVLIRYHAENQFGIIEPDRIIQLVEAFKAAIAREQDKRPKAVRLMN